MDGAGEDRFDLSVAKATASDAAREWGLELGEPFAFSHASYVAPAGDAVLKVAWEGDDESLHEGDALALWDGDGAVRLRRRSGARCSRIAPCPVTISRQYRRTRRRR